MVLWVGPNSSLLFILLVIAHSPSATNKIYSVWNIHREQTVQKCWVVFSLSNSYGFSSASSLSSGVRAGASPWTLARRWSILATCWHREADSVSQCKVPPPPPVPAFLQPFEQFPKCAAWLFRNHILSLTDVPCPVFSLPTICFPQYTSGISFVLQLAGYLWPWLPNTVMYFQKRVACILLNSRCFPLCWSLDNLEELLNFLA